MGRGSNISAMNSFEGGMVSDLHVGSSPSNTVTNALTWSLSPWVKPVYFSKYKRAEACIRSSEFYDGNKKPVHPLGIKINNILHTFLLVPLEETVLCYRRYRYFSKP
jgi:hypothetical protein